MHLVVFSHLRWSFVYQRPQHLLSRIAAEFPVIYIEEPEFDASGARMDSRSPCPGVEVLRPHTAVTYPGFHDEQLSQLQPMVRQVLNDRGIVDFAVWFYTPMALPFLTDLAPRLVIYDCMDELSAFKGAPRQMRQRESALMLRADAVFTGGPSLYEAKKAQHPNAICLPSAVDAEHYSAGRLESATAPLQRSILEPRLGFFGVIDERLDLELLAQLADADPSWQIVMVGPVVKIDPATLPRRPNIHWLEQQDYAVLPQLVAGWTVCLMPFALNESTRFISPTKTLEYMAAGKPVVSTRIHDVVEMFGELVELAGNAGDFIEACRRLLRLTEAELAERQRAMAAMVGRFSWASAARRVVDEIARLSSASRLEQLAIPDRRTVERAPAKAVSRHARS